MKISLSYSVLVGLNAVLIAAWVVHLGDPRNDRRRLADSQPKAAAVLPAVASSPSLVAAGVPPPSPALARVTLGGDWRSWLEPLRAAGVPASVLATLVREDFDRRWKAKENEAQRKYREGLVNSEGVALLGLEHDARLEEETRAALGEVAYRRWDMERTLEGFNLNDVSLSAAERAVVYDLQRRLLDGTRDDQIKKLQGEIDGAALDSRQHAAEEEMMQQLRTLLGDQRAARLQGTDTAVDNVRRSLPDLVVNDAQIQELADLQLQWDRTRSDLTALETSTQDTKPAAALSDAEEKWRTEVQRIVGPDALEPYLRAQDTRYVDLQRLAGNGNLSSAEADRIYALIADYDDAVREYGRDARLRNVDPASAKATVKQFAQQAEQSLQSALGPQRYEQLKASPTARLLAY